MDTNYMPLGQPKNGRPRIRHGLGFLFLALVFLALIVYQIYSDHSVTAAHAQASVENLTMTLESKLEQALMEAQWEVNAVATNIDVEAMQPANANRYRPQISRWLKSQASPIPGASALRIFDANGDSLYSSNDNEPAFNIADRKYFRQLQGDPSIQVLFSDVLSGRASGQPTVFAARAVRDRNRAFLGIALNGIELASLHKYFSVLELGTEGMVAVRRLDNGALVVRYPRTFEINNKPVMDLPSRLALLKDGRPETINNRSPVDGIHRIYSYRKIGDFPFFIVVGASAKDYLAGWRQNAFISLLTSLLFLASLAAVYLRLIGAEARRGQTMVLLHTSAERLRLMFDHASDGISIISISGDLVSVNEAFARMHGYTSEEMLGMNLKDLNSPESARLVPERVQRVLAGETLSFEAEHYHKDGHVLPLEVTSSLIVLEGQSVIQAFHRDVTERRQVEQALQQSLKDQHALLMEVHHRVKNNLQVISSLLRMESARSIDAAAKSVLKAMQGRVRSMALLHESIYRSGTFAAIDLGDYLRQIANQLFSALNRTPGAVKLCLELGSVQIGIDQALPCGLLVSELLSNALKHAFPNDHSGQVLLQLEQLEESANWRLRVSDTGVGLSEDFESRRQQSLGLQLVSNLATQIGRSLQIGPGSTFTVDFKVDKPAPLVMPV